MKSRRSFLSDLAVGVACLCFRFRAESAVEVMGSHVVGTGEWGVYKYVISSAYKPFHPPKFIPILDRRPAV